jgi:hypothetical protein
MISFIFCVNHSFKEYPWHPVTVPKSRVSYAEVAREMGRSRAGVLRLPDGSEVPVVMAAGKAGFGPYLQLRTRVLSEWVTRVARIGQLLTIRISSAAGGFEVSADLQTGK